MAKSKKQMVKDELIKNGGEERKIVAENGMSSNYVWISKEGFEATKEIIISLGGRITELVGEKSTLISVYHGNTSRGMIDFRVEEIKEVEAVKEVVVSEATEQEKELSKTKEDILRNLKVFGLNGDSDRVEANIIVSSIGIHLKVYVDGKIVYSKKLSDDNRTFGEILLFVEMFLTYIDYHELDDKALQEALSVW